MPKFPIAFGRRKSAGNALDDINDAPVAQSSFKVFEQPGSKSFDGAVKFKRVASGNVPSLVPKPPRREENMFEGLVNNNRGSGTSNSNTASTTDNSSRLSATSTAPSSTDVPRGDEWRSPHDMPFNNIPVPPVPKSSSTFSLKASGRTFSFGRSKNTNTPPPPPLPSKDPSPPLPDREYETGRARAVTASSYASTATPPKLDDEDFALNLGGNFADMFSSIAKRKSQMLESENRGPALRSPVRVIPGQTAETKLTSRQPVQPSGPAVRSFSSNHSNQPSPLNLGKGKDVEPSPYSSSSQHSHDRLMQSSTPPPPAPRNEDHPSAPLHRPSGSNNNAIASSRTQRPGGAGDTGLRRNSGHNGRRQSFAEHRKSIDEDARLLREAANASQRLNLPENGPKVRDSWAFPSNQQYKPDEAAVSGHMNGGSAEKAPGVKTVELRDSDDSMFDNHIAESANLAQKFEEIAAQPQSSKFVPRNKVMTPAQFEKYKKDQERLSSYGGRSKDDDEEEEEETYDDEDDEVEKNRKLAKQRRKQEAHMSVYRQQMMKLTGEAPSGLGAGLRPTISGTQSSPNLVTLGISEDKEEEDEEVPLAILQAHGFPNKNKPPMRSMGSIPNLRAQSAMSGALPVFARNLPQDPYVGAGLAYPTNRESMGFSGGSASIHGGSARGLPAGGLVGVIANEERSRAMRRGSPKPLGEYPAPPANGFDGMGGVSPNLRASTMMGGIGPINPMMLSPGDQAQLQMSQQMQEFMQMQVQFMQLMTGGQTLSPHGQNQPQPLGDPSQPRNSQVPQIRPGSSHQRSQTMLETSSTPWMPQGGLFAPSVRGQGGYAASIAPSERSNVGMPGRYRPVSHVPVADSKSRVSSIEGALQGWDAKNRLSTVKVVQRSGPASDEDDEEGWEEMAKKREKKRSLWRTKKENNEMMEVLNYT